MRYWLIPLLLCSLPCLGQLSSGIISAPRAVAWQNNSPGVVGGIPSASWTQCGTTIVAGASASTIQSAITACGTNQYVLLGAGTFNLSTGLNMKANVVLRGSGPNSTNLVFSGGVSCGGEGGQICFIDSSGYYYGSTAVAVGGTNSCSWTADYSSGATTIQLSSCGSAGIVNGQYIMLDQENDNPSTPSTSWNNRMLICDNTSATDGCSLEGGSPGRSYSGVDRNLIQFVKVVSGCSSACTGAGPFTVTITPGLYGQKWSSSATPGAWWSSSTMQNAGLENLSINSNAVGSATESGIYFNNAFNCWVNNVKSVSPNRNHVWLWQSAHNTIQNSYFFGTQSGAQQSYGVEFFIAGDNLVQNNIFQQVVAPIINGPSMGNVIFANFGINNLDPALGSTWMQIAPASRHDAGANYNLFEENIETGFWNDVFHGTGGANTAFRNYGTGWEPGKSSDTVAYQSYSYNRFDNAVGNVWGCNNTTSTYPGNCGSPYPATYQATNGSGASKQIYDLGSGNTETSTVVLADPYVATSFMRWGNYDVKNAATQWNNSEVPSGLTDGYSNPIPSSETLPNSFWTSSEPSWWGNAPWPAIGPDVTNGTIPGVASHVAMIPAASCYFTTMGGPQDGSGSVLTFNAATCYTSGTTYPLTITKTGNGTGTLGGTAAGSYAAGTTITITESWTSGNVFTQWGGSCSGMGTCSFSMPAAPATVTANFVATSAQYLNIDTLTPASTPNTSNPGWNINNLPADTGGVNTPASVSQTIGNSSPAGGCSSLSMLDSMTTIATSTQTNALFWYYGTGNDSSTNFIEDHCIYVTNIAAANNVEMDFDQYNLMQGRLYSFGHQCHIGGFWQYANNSSGWQNTSVSCSLTGAAWHHVIWTGHRINGDTSCGGVACNYYDELTVDGTSYAINATLPNEALPGGYPSALIDQFQIDAGPTSGTAATVSYNVDDVNFSAYGATPSGTSPSLLLMAQ